MAKVTVLVCALLSAVYSAYAVQNGVPVLIWSNKNLADLPETVTGHNTPSDTFHRDYLSKLLQDKQQNILLFIQDKLSVDDITRYADVFSDQSDGAAFHNLKELMENSPSAHLPSVSSATDALSKLQKSFQGKVHSLSEPYSVDSLPLDKAANNLVVVDLPKTKPDEAGFEESLKHIDGVMGSLSKQFKDKDVPYTAIYTAERSSRVRREAVYTGRHLLAEKDTTDYFKFNDSKCLIFYARNITIQSCDATAKGDKPPCGSAVNLPFPEEPYTLDCNDTSAELTFSYNHKVGDFDSLKFRLLFNKTSRRSFWSMSRFNVTFKLANNSAEATERSLGLVSTFVQAPMNSSYHCTTTSSLKEHAPPPKEKTVRVQLLGFQVQFGRNNDTFGPANDCVGFFSIAILSGLTVALILTLILAFGIAMIMNITTMDRFDDPKGKTITVTLAE